MEELRLSCEDLYELMGSFLKGSLNCRMKIQCLGCSMAPFIKDRDIVTLKPLDKDSSLNKGDIVAVAVHHGKRIVIHRIINANPPRYRIKGDNNRVCDGWFHKDDIFGVVERVEKTDGSGYTPKQWQNLIIAAGSRVNILKDLFSPGLKLLKSMR